MKEQFEQILKRLGYSYKFKQYTYYDVDGYDVNPTPNVLIRIRYSKLGKEEKDYSSVVGIDLMEISTNYAIPSVDHPFLSYRVIINGVAICESSGLVDYLFYFKILKNWQSFTTNKS